MGECLSRRAKLVLVAAVSALTAATYLTPPSIFQTIDWVRIHVFYQEYAAAAVREGRLGGRDGRPPSAERACRRAVTLFETHAGPVHVDTAHALIALAEIFEPTGVTDFDDRDGRSHKDFRWNYQNRGPSLVDTTVSLCMNCIAP